MGQAKRRGTFETRKAEAIARQEADRQERERRWREYEASLTPAERRAKGQVALLSAFLLGIAINTGVKR